MKKLQEQEKVLTALEKRIKEAKAEIKILTDELEHKLLLKRLGADEFKADNQLLLKQVDAQIAGLDENNKEGKKKIKALKKDKAALQARINKTDALLNSIGGQLTEPEAKALILRKLFDVASQELSRYLSAEKRALTASFDHLWDKYAVSRTALESARAKSLEGLDRFLVSLGYTA